MTESLLINLEQAQARIAELEAELQAVNADNQRLNNRILEIHCVVGDSIAIGAPSPIDAIRSLDAEARRLRGSDIQLAALRPKLADCEDALRHTQAQLEQAQAELSAARLAASEAERGRIEMLRRVRQVEAELAEEKRLRVDLREIANAGISEMSDFADVMITDKRLLTIEVQRLQAELATALQESARLQKAYCTTASEIEQTLGKALGYPELYPHASDVNDGAVCVGDHVPETLAAEAAKKIAELKQNRAAIAERVAMRVKAGIYAAFKEARRRNHVIGHECFFIEDVLNTVLEFNHEAVTAQAITGEGEKREKQS